MFKGPGQKQTWGLTWVRFSGENYRREQYLDNEGSDSKGGTYGIYFIKLSLAGDSAVVQWTKPPLQHWHPLSVPDGHWFPAAPIPVQLPATTPGKAAADCSGN